MCGITGKINLNGKPVHKKEIEAMNAVIRHRGPDDTGVYLDKNIGLGNQRLAIIDLSKKGHMPMSTKEGRYTITYNGEIYNFSEIRSELEEKGYDFRSNSDTEVVLKAYAEFGTKCLEKFRGMFAIAIWDKKKRELFFARDRLGKKPFKYYHDKNHFIFSSELKAIIKNSEVPVTFDRNAIDVFLTLRYLPSPMTGFSGIKKLPAGTYGILKEANNKLTIKMYWSIDFTKKEEKSELEWTEQIREELVKSIRYRMISDVEIGVFLSGGLDSSVIAGLVSGSTSKKVNTYSVGYKEKRHSELAYAKKVAKHFGTNHTELFVDPTIKKDLTKMIYQFEEPFGDPAAIPSYYMSQVTGKKLKVMLNGDGGDENFAGYPVHRNYKLIAKYAKVPKKIRELISYLVNVTGQMSQVKGLKHVAFKLEAMAKDPQQAFLYNFGCFHQDISNKYYLTRNDLYSNDYRNDVNYQEVEELAYKLLRGKSGYDEVDKVSNYIISSYLPDQLLPKVDLSSMAYSQEVRSPLLDHKFLELTAKIPNSLKIKSNRGKYIFKKTFENFIPSEIIERPKTGFSVPLEEWFRKDLYKYVSEILLDKNAVDRGYFKKEAIEKLLTDHKRGVDYSNHLWLLVVLELWQREFMD